MIVNNGSRSSVNVIVFDACRGFKFVFLLLAWSKDLLFLFLVLCLIFFSYLNRFGLKSHRMKSDDVV